MGVRALALAVLAGLAVSAPSAQAAQPVELAAPYEYLGWGDPQPPANVMAASGVQDLTLAFILSKGMQPRVGRRRPLLGGADSGGDRSDPRGGRRSRRVVRRLERQEARQRRARRPAALAAAYQKVIDAYSLQRDRHRHRARRVQQQEGARAGDRGARGACRARTRASRSRSRWGPKKPDPNRRSQPDRAKPRRSASSRRVDDHAVRLRPPATDMGHASIRALEGLAARSRRRLWHLARRRLRARRHLIDERADRRSLTRRSASKTSRRCLRSRSGTTSRAAPSGRSIATGRAPARSPKAKMQRHRQAPFAFSDVVARYHG